MKALGQTRDQIFALDGDWKSFSPRERALFTIARNLAASPVVLTDAQVAKALDLAGPRDVVQMLTYTTPSAVRDASAYPRCKVGYTPLRLSEAG